MKRERMPRVSGLTVKNAAFDNEYSTSAGKKLSGKGDMFRDVLCLPVLLSLLTGLSSGFLSCE